MTGCAGAPACREDAGGGREMASGWPRCPGGRAAGGPRPALLGGIRDGGRTPPTCPHTRSGGAHDHPHRQLSVGQRHGERWSRSPPGGAYKDTRGGLEPLVLNDQPYAATLRVPAEFSMPSSPKCVTWPSRSVENISGNDVTEEYADINARTGQPRGHRGGAARASSPKCVLNRGKAEEIVGVSGVRAASAGRSSRSRAAKSTWARWSPCPRSTCRCARSSRRAPWCAIEPGGDHVERGQHAVEVVKTFVSVIIYVVVLFRWCWCRWLSSGYGLVPRRRKARKASEPEAQA